MEIRANDEGLEPHLKFAEIYTSPAWKELDAIDRAQLILVAEGVKPGTIIHGNFTSFQTIVQKMGLEIHQNSEPHTLAPVFEVGSPSVMAERYRSRLLLPKKLLASSITG